MTSTTSATTRAIDWIGTVIPYIKRLLDNEYTFHPTIRGIFYRAGSDKVIPLTTAAYKGLIRALSTARKDGKISMNAFTDNSRQILDIDDTYWEPEDLVSRHLGILQNLHEIYYDTIPTWQDQPHYSEIFIEKDAVVGTFQEILVDRQVRIVPNRGWSSITYEYNNIQRLLAKVQEGKIVHVLYFGDYDPSGIRMSHNLGLKLQGYGIDFKRVALTKSQIIEFGLEHLKNPDPEVLQKLKRDPNADAFIRENGSLFQIETDALQKDPAKLRKLVLDSIVKYFDNNIFDELQHKFSKKNVYDLVNQRVGEFLDNRDSDGAIN